MSMERYKLKFKKSTILYLVFFAAFIRPEYLVRMSKVKLFYDLLKITMMAFIPLIFTLKRKPLSKFTILWFVFEAWIVFVTVFRGADISFAINQALTVCTIALFFDMYSDDMRHVCKVLYRFLGLLIFINFVTLLVFPAGMYVTGVTNTASENWFLGFKNKHMIYFLPFVGLNLILGNLEGFTWKNFVMLAIVLFSALFAGSSTIILCLALILIVGFMPFVRKNYKVFNMYSYFGLSIVLFILIPLLRLQYLFSFLIVTVLNKGIDLTYRTNLWDLALREIREHPIIGWGEQSVDVKHLLYHSHSIISAHNQILEYLYIGGIVLLTLYIIINLLLAKKLTGMRRFGFIQVASGMYLALQVALIAEVYTDASIYMIYFILWYIDRLNGRSE